MGAKFFSGGFEEDVFSTCLPQQVFMLYRRAACHNNSSMVRRLSQASKKIYVERRKKIAGNPRK
jgi:hypothetical protein